MPDLRALDRCLTAHIHQIKYSEQMTKTIFWADLVFSRPSFCLGVVLKQLILIIEPYRVNYKLRRRIVPAEIVKARDTGDIHRLEPVGVIGQV